MKYHVNLYLGLLLCLFSCFISAQQNILTSGAEVSGSSGTLNFSVGQIVYTTNSTGTGTSFEGIQLPFEIFNEQTLNVDVIPDIKLGIKVYPNPTLSKLTLSVNVSEDMQYHIYDINGKLLVSERVTNSQTIIPMDKYPPAVYSIILFSNNTPLKSFKIIKK